MSYPLDEGGDDPVSPDDFALLFNAAAERLNAGILMAGGTVLIDAEATIAQMDCGAYTERVIMTDGSTQMLIDEILALNLGGDGSVWCDENGADLDDSALIDDLGGPPPADTGAVDTRRLNWAWDRLHQLNYLRVPAADGGSTQRVGYAGATWTAAKANYNGAGVDVSSGPGARAITSSFNHFGPPPPYDYYITASDQVLDYDVPDIGLAMTGRVPASVHTTTGTAPDLMAKLGGSDVALDGGFFDLGSITAGSVSIQVRFDGYDDGTFPEPPAAGGINLQCDAVIAVGAPLILTPGFSY